MNHIYWYKTLKSWIINFKLKYANKLESRIVNMINAFYFDKIMSDIKRWILVFFESTDYSIAYRYLVYSFINLTKNMEPPSDAIH